MPGQDPPSTDTKRSEHVFVVCDGLEKVFLDTAPRRRSEVPLTSFLGERTSFQVAWQPPTSSDLADLPRLQLSVDAGPGADVTLSLVRSVPVQLAVHADHDHDYPRTAPGLYPDLLEPLPEGQLLRSVLGAWQAVWVDVSVEELSASGPRHIAVEVRAHEGPAVRADEPGAGRLLFSTAVDWVVRAVPLPELDITVTQWLHVDCLSEHYRVEPFGEDHWRIVEAHLASVRAMGSNAVMTPLFTSPLDVREGQHRPRTQLLGISGGAGADEALQLDFTALDRWVKTCRRHGLTTLEMPPLFSQWGAAAAAPWWVGGPGGEELRFGWGTPATAPEYRSFLAAVLPAVIEHLATAWPETTVVWHVSDEPSAERLPAYRAAREGVSHLLAGQTVVDAVSDPSFVAEGVMSTPVVATDAVASFRGVTEDFWVYYCNAQHRHLSNRFIAMSGVRTRVLGRQLFDSGARGFLHWGFNYWFAQLSEGLVDPFTDTTAGGAFPAGDAFVVYPGPDGVPWESLRHRLVGQAVADHRALQLLRDLGRGTAGESGTSLAGDEGPFATGVLDPRQHLLWRWQVDEEIAGLLPGQPG